MGTQTAPLLRRSSRGNSNAGPTTSGALSTGPAPHTPLPFTPSGATPFLQRKLVVGAVSDPLEAEAEQMADRVMASRGPVPGPPPTSSCSHAVQRCSCESCSKKNKKDEVMQRSPDGASAARVTDAPPLVHEVLATSGHPLHPELRGFLEPRFGRDFSHVRVHTDERAAASASSVYAAAYTVGDHVVLGSGQYSPASAGTRRLLAHELTHTLQQGRGTGTLQRACLPAADCAAPRATLTEFVTKTEAEPVNISKADKRKKACTKVPRKASCTSDGHGAKATALTAVMKAHYPSRLPFVTGIFVDKDIPAKWGAVTMGCGDFMPPLPGGQCTFVPDSLEVEARAFQKGAPTIGASSRENWLTSSVGTLAHETEHARFEVAPAVPAGPKASCKFDDIKSNLTELLAPFAEMHVFYRAAIALPHKDRFKRFDQMWPYWIQNGSEDIADTVKDMRCRCECADADHFITKSVAGVESTQKWDSYEHYKIHRELKDPKWKLNWPVDPGTPNISDIPAIKAAPLKFE